MKTLDILEDDQGIREAMEVLFPSENFEVRAFTFIAEFMNAICPFLPDIFA